jgi:phosphatidylserine/phosphatidylglycerophosphate/cardiolipin synthase-like enzyme
VRDCPRIVTGLAALLGLSACVDARPNASTPRVVETAASRAEPEPEIELVESAPAETTLDHADVRDASVVWPEMIDRAKRTIDLSHFYASEIEGEPDTSRLTPVIAALERAASRGVRVRFLVDGKMAEKYPTTLEHLRAIGKGLTLKSIDAKARYGGVQHAKYFVVDGDEVFVGSQNFDWRALAHIQEMGVRVRSTAIAGALTDVFDTDWTLADRSSSADARAHAHAGAVPEAKTAAGESIGLYASPKGWLPDESRWDLARLVSLIDGAKSTATLQVLDYSTQSYDNTSFTTLDDAMRRAARRGVRVRVLVSHWGAKPGSAARRSVEALAAVPNVEARVITIPPWTKGEIPFARVSHAKYLVIDGRTTWIGTSNWEGDYFLKSRNVAIVAEGGKVAPRLARIFEDGWTSAYAAPLRR